jgi:hypothetical protein
MIGARPFLINIVSNCAEASPGRFSGLEQIQGTDEPAILWTGRRIPEKLAP